MAISVSSNKKSSIGKPSNPTVHGGNAHMLGRSGAVPAKAQAMVTHGTGSDWAKGGGGYMCKFSGVKAAKAL